MSATVGPRSLRDFVPPYEQSQNSDYENTFNYSDFTADLQVDFAAVSDQLCQQLRPAHKDSPSRPALAESEFGVRHGRRTPNCRKGVSP
jgi:hypothetical protein